MNMYITRMEWEERGLFFLILAYVSSCDEHLFSPPFASSYLEYKKIMHYDD